MAVKQKKFSPGVKKEKKGSVPDNKKITDMPKFTRKKNELDPQNSLEPKAKEPKSLGQYIDMVHDKRDEEKGIY